MKRLHYCGPLLDSSGYGEAARGYLASLHTVQGFADLTAYAIQYEPTPADLGEMEWITRNYLRDHDHPDVVFSHCMATQFPRFINRKAYNIGITVWETDKLPEEWVDRCNEMDEIWTSTEFSARVFARSGVERPIQVFPHAVNLVDYSPQSHPLFTIGNVHPGAHVFYNIGTWSERKDQVSLLHAYCQEFSDRDNVCLLLKTYHHTREQHHKKSVYDEILSVLNKYPNRPPVLMAYGWNHPDQVMVGIHNRAHTYVSTHRGECPGLPMVQAMACGNPVIATNWSGISEYLDESIGWPLDYSMVPVRGMTWWRFYDSSQNWAQVCRDSLRKAMREAYNDPEEARRRGRAGRQRAVECFSWERIGRDMMRRINSL